MSIAPESIAAIVLAAGKGTRMKSQLPKVLHTLCGTPMIGHVIRSLEGAGIRKKCVVVGGDVERLQSYLQAFPPLSFALQRDRLGTGEAVACAGFALQNTQVPAYASGTLLSGEMLSCTHVLICAGDTPAIDASVIREFLNYCRDEKADLAVLGMDHPTPKGYGRLVCDQSGQLQKIVEEKDASAAEKGIRLCNSGIIFAERSLLFSLLDQVKPNNVQKEYYLTDCFALAREKGKVVKVWTTPDYASFDGINDRNQLAQLEERLNAKLCRQWMEAGISFRLPATTYLETTVTIGEDSEIGPNVSLLGRTEIGRNCEIGSHAVLKDVIIPDGTRIHPGTVRIGS
jgi:bifunctional UDP-N-acetylglucosamine pyrophosphorylase/glucosamine-1-phosphate N-acetyltransferase